MGRVGEIVRVEKGERVKGREGELWSVCKMKKELNEKERLFHFITLS